MPLISDRDMGIIWITGLTRRGVDGYEFKCFSVGRSFYAAHKVLATLLILVSVTYFYAINNFGIVNDSRFIQYLNIFACIAWVFVNLIYFRYFLFLNVVPLSEFFYAHPQFFDGKRIYYFNMLDAFSIIMPIMLACLVFIVIGGAINVFEFNFSTTIFSIIMAISSLLLLIMALVFFAFFAGFIIRIKMKFI